jgi:UDP-glucuronate decarboxylase
MQKNKESNLQTILVTGGAGFLGSHLCERLLKEGHRVICLDNFCTGHLENINSLSNHPHFLLVEHDICHPIDIEIDQIYNLACPASPLHYQCDPIKTMKTSIYGAIHMLELAQKTGAHLLQASTSEVYGDPEVHPQREDYWGHVNPIGTRSCYDEGKRCAETLCLDFHRLYPLTIKIVRIFNTYGPRMDMNDGRVVSNFIVQALKNSPLTIYGDGTQTRSFCYCEDLIEGLVRMMNTPSDWTGPVNLGNPVEFTIRELADLVLALTGSQSKILYCPLPQDDPKKRRPDIGLAQDRLHWEPKTPLKEGLVATIEYFDRLLRQGARATLYPK